MNKASLPAHQPAGCLPVDRLFDARLIIVSVLRNLEGESERPQVGRLQSSIVLLGIILQPFQVGRCHAHDLLTSFLQN